MSIPVVERPLLRIVENRTEAIPVEKELRVESVLSESVLVK
jgi:hypothetical protein